VAVVLSADLVFPLDIAVADVQAAATARRAAYTSTTNDGDGFTNSFYVGTPPTLAPILCRLDEFHRYPQPSYESVLKAAFEAHGVQRQVTSAIFFKVRASSHGPPLKVNGPAIWQGGPRLPPMLTSEEIAQVRCAAREWGALCYSHQCPGAEVLASGIAVYRACHQACHAASAEEPCGGTSTSAQMRVETTVHGADSIERRWRCTSEACREQEAAAGKRRMRLTNWDAETGPFAATQSIRERFELHQRTPSDINEHLATLRQYASRVGSIVEMGVRGAVSTWALLLGLTESSAPGKSMIGVDLMPCDYATAHALGARVGIQVAFRQGDSASIALPPRDLLFIDTWHVYAHLRRELAAHHASTRRYILLHDTEVDGIRGESLRLSHDTAAEARQSGYAKAEIEQGLQAAITEFVDAHRDEWRVERVDRHNNGLTVLERIGTAVAGGAALIRDAASPKALAEAATPQNRQSSASSPDTCEPTREGRPPS